MNTIADQEQEYLVELLAKSNNEYPFHVRTKTSVAPLSESVWCEKGLHEYYIYYDNSVSETNWNQNRIDRHSHWSQCGFSLNDVDRMRSKQKESEPSKAKFGVQDLSFEDDWGDEL